MVSLCFDDGFDAHLDIAIPELNRRGWRGTFFVPIIPFDLSYNPPKPFTADGKIRAEDWRRAASEGHEIATHCVHHCHEREMEKWSSETAKLEAETAKATIESITGKEVKSHAYPKGYFTPTIKAAVASCYAQARSVVYSEGLACGAKVDWFNVPTVCVNGWQCATRVPLVLDRTRSHDLWTALTFHAIGNDDSQCLNMRAEQFTAALDEIKKRGIEVVTFGEAAQRWREGR